MTLPRVGACFDYGEGTQNKIVGKVRHHVANYVEFWQIVVTANATARRGFPVPERVCEHLEGFTRQAVFGIAFILLQPLATAPRPGDAWHRPNDFKAHPHFQMFSIPDST
jgi:hypothetical protein